MAKKQDRRTLNLDTKIFEELTFRQSEVRLIMKNIGSVHILSKTSRTKLLETMIKHTSAETLVKILNSGDNR